MADKVKIGLFGAIGVPNVGDEAILIANIEIINKIFDRQCEIYVFTKDASYTSLFTQPKFDNVRAISYLHQLIWENLEQIKSPEYFNNMVKDESNQSILVSKLKDIFKNLNYFHFVGGGYICSYWPDMILETWLASIFARTFKVPYILTGISAYIFDGIGKRLFSDICNHAVYVDLRDHSIDMNYLTDGHLYNKQVFRSTDDAIFLSYDMKNHSNSKYINLILHPWKSTTKVLLNKLDEVLWPLILKYLHKNSDAYVNILCFSEEDGIIWSKFLSRIEKESKNKVHFWGDCTQISASKVKELIAKAEFNISSRFHATVFSLSAGVPVYSLISDNYYNQKILSIHQLFEDDHYCDIAKLTSNDLKNFQEYVKKNAQKIVKNRVKVETLYNEKIQRLAEFYAMNRKAEDILLKLHEGIPKVTVIIPVYNMSTFLRKCLDSIKNQTLTDLEIICVNDGSTDNSKEILDEYAWKDSRFRIINQENSGVSAARNRAIKIAKGEYLFFIDPDDWFPDNAVLMDLYTKAKANGALVCGGGFEEHGINGVITTWEGNASKYTFEKEGFIDYESYQFDYGWVRFIYNREFILRNELCLPNLTFFEDPVFFVNTMHKAKKFYALPRMSYCYRSGHHSYELTYNKVLDLVKGITDNIKLAKNNAYDDLYELEIYRLKRDYAGQIAKYLGAPNNQMLKEEFDILNEVINDGTRIEYEIMQSVIDWLNYVVWQNSSGKEILKRKVTRRIKSTAKFILPNKIINILKKARKKYNE